MKLLDYLLNTRTQKLSKQSTTRVMTLSSVLGDDLSYLLLGGTRKHQQQEKARAANAFPPTHVISLANGTVKKGQNASSLLCQDHGLFFCILAFDLIGKNKIK